MFFGLMILVIGVVFLLKNLGILTSDVWDVIWPVIIILVGISIIVKPHHRVEWSRKKEQKEEK